MQLLTPSSDRTSIKIGVWTMLLAPRLRALFVRPRPELARSVTQDLQALLAENRTDEQLRDILLAQYHLYYDPWGDEISMREWLSGLFKEIGEALERNDEASVDQPTL